MAFSQSDRNIFALFKTWIGINGYQKQRSFLKAHLELLAPQHYFPLTQQIMASTEWQHSSLTDWEELHKYVLILRSASEVGSIIEAIDTAFVNFFSGFALDIPDWMAGVPQQLDQLGAGSQTAAQRLHLLAPLTERANIEPDVPPALLASLHLDLARAIFEITSLDLLQKYEQAIINCKEALKVYTPSYCPVQYALGLTLLGSIYGRHLAGERRTNIEIAIQCYHSAHQFYTREDFPVEWALLCNNLGGYYLVRIEGNKDQNIQRAIHYYRQALEVITPENSHEEWTALVLHQGIAYQRLTRKGHNNNAIKAITCFEQVLAANPKPEIQALTILKLGDTYLHLDRLADAVASYQTALAFYTQKTDPVTWATVQANLGATYARRPGQKPFSDPRLAAHEPYNLLQGIQCYQAALQVFTHDVFPAEHRNIQITLGDIALEQGNWTLAHQAYEQALLAQDRLLQQGTGAAGHDAALEDEKNVHTKNGFALFRMGQLETAAIAIERGRVHGLTKIPSLSAATHIHNESLQQQFIAARAELVWAQRRLDMVEAQEAKEKNRQELLRATADYREKQECLNSVIAAIREAEDSADFLQDTLDEATILQAAQSCDPNHALVYLAATYLGGMAVAAISVSGSSSPSGHFVGLNLPDLTYPVVRGLVQRTLDGKVIGGYAHVQEGNALALVCQQCPGGTLRACAEALHALCTRTELTSTLDEAIQQLLKLPELDQAIDLPLDSAAWNKVEGLVSMRLRQLFLELELQHCFAVLASSAMRPLLNWLHKQNIDSFTLIPCGPLAAFPLISVPIDETKTVGDIYPASMAASARSLLLRTSPSQTERSGVYALGDPWPSHQKLPWGEAEAHTLKKLAQLLGLPAEARVQLNASRKWLIESAFSKGRVVSIACHGTFDKDNFLRSALLLAWHEKILLGDLLNGVVDLHGLRLLILSACQTEVLNLGGAYNEVRSLAVGAIQAGANAVLGSLWSVDDRATYLLIVRFAQEWFTHIESEPPVAAFARAQNWLRHVTNQQLMQWSATTLPGAVFTELQEVGSQQTTEQCSQDSSPIDISPLVVAAEPIDRHITSSAETRIRWQSANQADSLACPYASPGFWAGFQVTGW